MVRASKRGSTIPARKVSPEVLLAGLPAGKIPFGHSMPSAGEEPVSLPKPGADVGSLLAAFSQHTLEAPVLSRLKDLSLQIEREKSASTNIRKACNSIKMLTCIVSALARRPDMNADAQVAASSANLMISAAQSMCDLVLAKLSHGESGTFPTWVQKTILLTTTKLVTDAWVAERTIDETYIASQVDLLVLVARAKVPFLEVEFSQPAGGIEPVRLSLANALAPIVAEIDLFNFFHDPDVLTEKAGQTILETAQKAAHLIAAEDSPEAARVMLLQNLISNAATIYLGVYQAHADRVQADFRAMPLIERRAALAAVTDPDIAKARGKPTGMDMSALENDFQISFARLVNVTQKQIEQLTAAAAPKAALRA